MAVSPGALSDTQTVDWLVLIRAEYLEMPDLRLTLTEAQRRVWMAVARTKKTRPRLLQCGRMPGFNYFVKINVARTAT